MSREPGAESGQPVWSLRRRLLLLIAVATLVAWVAGGAATYFILHRQSVTLSDQRNNKSEALPALQ